MAGKFEVFRDKAREYRFRLKAGNGEVILTSEGYNERFGCANGIESVRRNSTDTGRFKKIRTDSGRDNGIASVGRNAPDAEVVEAD